MSSIKGADETGLVAYLIENVEELTIHPQEVDQRNWSFFGSAERTQQFAPLSAAMSVESSRDGVTYDITKIFCFLIRPTCQYQRWHVSFTWSQLLDMSQHTAYPICELVHIWHGGGEQDDVDMRGQHDDDLFHAYIAHAHAQV